MLSTDTPSQRVKTIPTQILPEPPDNPYTHSQENPSPLNYKEILLANTDHVDLDIDPMDDVQHQSTATTTNLKQQDKLPTLEIGIKQIALSDQEKERLHHQ